MAFSFVDTSIIGQYSTFKIELGMKVSLGPTCFIKIDFPPEFTFDANLINVSATSFLKPSSGSTVSPLVRNDAEGIYVF